MDTWLKHRVSGRLAALGLGPVEAATAAGIERTYIRDIIEGRKASVRADGATKLAAALAAPKDYFLFEDFEWSPDGDTPAPTRTPQNNDLALPTSEQIDGAVQIPEYDVRLSAGGGALLESSDIKGLWRFPRDFVREMQASWNAMNIVEVIGDSMEPRLLPGDKVVIDQNDTNPTPPGVFALWDGYGLVVKHIQRVHGTNRLLLVSENTVYPPYEAVIDDIKIFGRIKSYIRKM